MKFICCLFLCAAAYTASAQDFCQMIKKEVSDDKKTFDYSSPYNVEDKNALRVNRAYSIDPEEPYDNFYIIFQMLGEIDQVFITSASGAQIEKEEKALVVEFDDKTKIADADIKIAHDFSEDRTQITRYVYFTVNSKNGKEFASKKIAKFTLAGYDLAVQPEEANALMHYVECLNAVKK